MKRTNIAVFLIILAAFAVVVTCFPRDPRTLTDENRSYNRFPELTRDGILGGTFNTAFEAWLSDRVGYRADFVAASRSVTALAGIARDAQVRGNLLVFPDRLMEIFIRNRATEAAYAAALTAYRDALPESVRVFSILAPTQIEFQPATYRSVADSERDAIADVYEQLHQYGVVTVDAYAELKARADEYIYFRTDHHWTARGAYCAYLAFAEAAGLNPVPLEAYAETALSGFHGYLYRLSPSPKLADAPDTLYYYANPEIETSPPLLYLPPEGEKPTYQVFLGGDRDSMAITTNANNGKTAVVIKDSYANSFIPWLAPHYDTIVVLDPRSFTGSAIDEILKYPDADVIFINYVLSTTFGDFIDRIDKIR
ncbi:MAG: hypothetical protein LBN30_00825 [Oscillospiraceae bacterium]|jgi:hypothetical protein|nr:hypothetical protein [Oscillospiraceae bacterium]